MKSGAVSALPHVLLAALLVSACEGNGAPLDASIDDAGSGRDAQPRDAGPDSGPPEAFDDFIDYQMRVGGIPGLAAAVIDDGAVELVVTRGMATRTTPVDEHTLFMVASISKTFVTALVLSLVEEGRLDLDAPIDDVLGYEVRDPARPDARITPRLLLTHASGLTDDWIYLGDVTREGDPDVTLDAFTRAYLTGERSAGHFARAPGTSRDYCNAGFGVLGQLVEAASGEDLRALSQARLFGPLALDGAGWFLADVDTTRLADEMGWNGSTFTPYAQKGFGHYPATSLRISVTGLARFLLAMMRDGELDGARVLTPESVAETRRVQDESVSSSQALSWYYRSLAGSRWLGHSGSAFGTSAQMLYRPEDGRGIVLLTNSDAYLRERVGDPSGDVAMEAILARLDAEADLR